MQTISDKAASQQATVIANQGVAAYTKEIISESRDIIKGKDSRKIDDPIKYLVSSDGGDADEGLSILKSHISKMMELFGDEKGGKYELTNNVNEAEDEALSEDFVRLSSEYAKRPDKRSRMTLSMNYEAFKDLNEGQKQLLKDYSTAYFSYLFSDDPKSFDKLRKLEVRLMEEGIPESKIFSVQKEMRNAARSEVAAKVKENMLIRDLSQDLDAKLHSFKATSVTDKAFFNEKLGGWDFGGYNDSLQGTVNRMNYENAKDFSKFSLEQLENELISKMVKGDKNIDDLQKIVELAGNTGIDVGNWLEKVWMKSKENLGFVPINVPEKEEGKIVSLNVSDFNSGKKDGNPDWDREKTEGEELSDKLRALYMHRLIKGDIFTHVSTMLEIRKCKNGLVRLGIFNKSFESKISFEAEILARKKVLEMIEEAFMEKSTFFKQKGAAFLSNEKRVAVLKAAASRLGLDLTDEDFEELKDKSNNAMLKVVESQISRTEDYLKTRKGVKAEKVLGKMKALRSRLVQEMSAVKNDNQSLEVSTKEVV